METIGYFHGELINIARVAAEELPSINSIASGAVPH